MKPLLAALLFCSCNKPISFIDETEATAQIWVCLYKDADIKHEQLMRMSVEHFAESFGEILKRDDGVNEL